MDLKAYYERIKLERPTKLDKNALDEIVRAHQCTIPFEDLESNYLKKQVSINPEVLFDKVITRKRGGYCFELNGLFKDFLCETGFDAFCVFCRVKSMERPVMHRGVFVRLEDGIHYVDVGFGGPTPFGSVKFEPDVRQDVMGETWWFEKQDDYWWALKRLNSDGEEEVTLNMTLQPQPDIEFESMNFYCCTNPEGRFVTVTLVNLRQPNGYYAITERTFTSSIDGVTKDKEIENDEEFRSLLKEYFGIVL